MVSDALQHVMTYKCQENPSPLHLDDAFGGIFSSITRSWSCKKCKDTATIDCTGHQGQEYHVLARFVLDMGRMAGSVLPQVTGETLLSVGAHDGRETSSLF